MPGGKVVVLAGGTDLLGILKDRVHAVYPEVVGSEGHYRAGLY